MWSPKTLKIFFLLSFFPLILGCDRFKATPPIQSLTEADERFTKILRDEYKHPVVVKRLKNTLWIYLPSEEPILNFKAKEKEKDQNRIIYIDTSFEGNSFRVRYNLGRMKDYGYEPGYLPEYLAQSQHISTAIIRTYVDLENNPQRQDKSPDFFVTVVTDIKNGVGIKAINHFKDINGLVSTTIPEDEYMKRTVGEVYGDPKAIGDREGMHLEIKEIVLSEFIAKQIETRFKLKFDKKDSITNPEDEILNLIAAATHYYSFEDFSAAQLNNLHTGKELSVGKDIIKTHFKD